MTERFVPIDDARSRLMKRVRRQGTDAELRVGELIRDLGARYRRNVKTLPGSPDFANRAKGWAVFVHGCFWHGHEPCLRATLPRHNRLLWKAKLEANRARDSRKARDLESLGFRVTTVWECELSDGSKLSRRLARVIMERIS